MKLKLSQWVSPLSPLLIVTDEQGTLRALEFADLESRLHRLLTAHYGPYSLEKGNVPDAIQQALTAYFSGRLNAFAGLPTATGGTPFQQEIWQALKTIPAGTTATYGQLAAQLGREKASRAVGAANGLNPICIVIPCHRVIGANGALTGYAGGLPRKKWLLDHERHHTPSTADSWRVELPLDRPVN